MITGVNGLIGRSLAQRLVHEGVPVRGLDLSPDRVDPRVEFFAGDVRDPESLVAPLRGCSVLVHCARWPGIPWSWDAAAAVEVVGTRNLYAAALRAGVARVVHLSSIAVYGPTRSAVITEASPF